MKKATLTMQVNIVRGGEADVRHTGLVGYLETTFEEIVDAIGEPRRYDERGAKVDAQWVLKVEGRPDPVLTIYNYKDGRNYLGDEGLAVERITEWHLGGRGAASLEIARALFGERVTPAR